MSSVSARLISNDRQAREAQGQIGDLDEALSSETIFRSMAKGLPSEVTESYRRSLSAGRDELWRRLEAYQLAREGNLDLLKKEAGGDLGSQLVVARIARGYTQKQLARKLGLQEQAIQRYEAERYRSISLSGFQRVAAVLDLRLTTEQTRGLANDWGLPFEVDHSAALKILKHAKSAGWYLRNSEPTEDGIDDLKRGIGEHLLKHGKPSLLRTGLGVHHFSGDLALVAWKTQVSRLAEEEINSLKSRFDITDIGWIRNLVKLSSDEDKLSSVHRVLAEQGVLLIYEAQIPGMRVDGASFIIDDIPVIGLTLRKDSIDSFWFTLLHELAHLVLHYWSGLQDGFFDDLDASLLDNVEQEANDFASNCLIPNELWIKSPARIAKAADPIQTLAGQLGIHPAIAFGRIRMERNDYTIFSDKIGQGKVRKALLDA